MIPRFLIVTALVAAIVLPITIAVLCGVGGLLDALGDGPGSLAIGRGALACGILWVLDLVCLVLMLALNVAQVGAPPGRDTTPESPVDPVNEEQ